MAEQIRCGDRELGQMLRRQRLPALTVPGQPVDGQDLGGRGRAVAVHMQDIGHAVDVRGMRMACVRRPDSGCVHLRLPDLSDPRGVMPTCPHHTPPPAAHSMPAGARGMVRVLGGPGTGKTTLLVQTAAAHIAAGGRSGIGSAADRFGAAGHPGARRDHRRAVALRPPRRGARTAGAHRALLRVRGAASGRAAQRRPAAAAHHQRRAGRHHPRTARRRPRGRRNAPRSPGRRSCGRRFPPSASPPNCAICWPAAPNAAWTPSRCSASAGCPAVPNGWPPASSRRPTSRSCCCVPRSAWRPRRRRCRRWARPNS